MSCIEVEARHASPPSFKDKEEELSQRRKLLRAAKLGFTVTDGPQEYCLETASGEEAGYLYHTVAQGKWLLVPPPDKDKLVVQDELYRLNGAGKELDDRELLELAPASSADHDASTLFLLLAWNAIRVHLYKGVPQIDSAYQYPSSHPKRYRELRINDYVLERKIFPSRSGKIIGGEPTIRRQLCGRVDFGGSGIDGQFSIIEFKRSRKKGSGQLARQELALGEIIKSHNGDHLPPPIRKFIGQYEVTPDLNIIRLSSPPEPRPFNLNHVTIFQDPRLNYDGRLKET